MTTITIEIEEKDGKPEITVTSTESKFSDPTVIEKQAGGWMLSHVYRILEEASKPPTVDPNVKGN